MIMPLYQPLNENPPKLAQESHRGLWYERFFNRYKPDWTVDKDGKSAWVTQNAKSCGDNKVLAQHAQRLLQLAEILGGDFKVFETNWHFATGLGLPHPVENGFAWHPTLGVPYLAGSAVKGLLRAWVEVWEPDGERLQTWFGEQEQAGQLLFFDALPIEPVNLIADVMTPHLGDWYQKGEQIDNPATQSDRIPADWHDPVPVPFLAVKPNTKLLFLVAPRTQTYKARVGEAFDALGNALNWLGAGAKTAAGYGHMQLNEVARDSLIKQRDEVIAEMQREKAEAERQAANAQRKAQMSPFELSMEELIEAKASQAGYITLLQKLKEGHWESSEDKKAVAESIKERMVEAKVWKETTNAKNPGGDKKYQRTLEVKKYM